MSARSVKVIIVNTTDQVLTLRSSELDHGVWVQQPPATIDPHSSGTFEADSDGILTGVAGTVVYNIGTGQNQSVSLYFDNPYVGSDSFIPTVTPNTAYSCAVTTSGGNDAQVTLTLAAL